MGQAIFLIGNGSVFWVEMKKDGLKTGAISEVFHY
jgi:hypothetical protein